jgi:hypothetical protein
MCSKLKTLVFKHIVYCTCRTKHLAYSSLTLYTSPSRVHKKQVATWEFLTEVNARWHSWVAYMCLGTLISWECDKQLS